MGIGFMLQKVMKANGKSGGCRVVKKFYERDGVFFLVDIFVCKKWMLVALHVGQSVCSCQFPSLSMKCINLWVSFSGAYIFPTVFVQEPAFMLVNIHLQLFFYCVLLVFVCCELDFLTDQCPLCTYYILGIIEVLSGCVTQKTCSVVFHGNGLCFLAPLKSLLFYL